MKNSAKKFFGVWILTLGLLGGSSLVLVPRLDAQMNPPAGGPTAQEPAASERKAVAPPGGANVLKSQPAGPRAVPTPAANKPLGSGAGAEPAKDGKPLPYRGPVTSMPKPIVIEKTTETVQDRLQRTITLDVREMNVLDVLKFLALKGDFNMITGNQVAGRVTLYLKNVKIQDALDIIVISNNLAYYLEKDIVYVLSDGEYGGLFGKRFNEKNNSVEIIQLKYAKPSYVLATLDSLKSGLGKIIIDEDTGTVVMIDTPEALAKMKKGLDEIESPMEPIIYSIQYAKADVLAEKLRARVDANAVGSIMVDERSNKLVVRALPERRKEVEKLIQALDEPTKEVLIEVRVLQVVFKPEMSYGIDWQKDFKDSSVSALRKLSFTNLTQTTTSTIYGKIAYGTVNVDDFALSIKALKQVADTRILSNPRLLVTNNEEAKIHVGDTVPYIIATVSGTGDNAITSEDVRFIDVGVKISVTPTINDDGMVTMRLLPEISTVTSYVETAKSKVPQVNKTMLESTIMVQDGMTIVLGGLKKENKVQARRGIPGLMEVPYLKYLFSSVTESIEATEIVIFITPHIIRGDEDFRKYKGDIKPMEEYSAAEGGHTTVPVAKLSARDSRMSPASPAAKPSALQLKD